MATDWEGQQTIGIVGGGQLGRMLTLAAQPLGFKVVVINPTSNSPAAQVGAQEIVADLYDPAALTQLAQLADFITIEIEHLDANELQAIADLGKPVNPAPKTIAMIQEKLAQKQALHAAGIAMAPFEPVETIADATAALQKFGGKMLLKTRQGGYDGRGNMVISSAEDIAEAFKRFEDRQLYAEAYVPFTKELAVMIARDLDGSLAVYPVVETIHERNICVEVLAPAPLEQAMLSQAESLARQVAEHLEGAGMFGVEMFLTEASEVIVNEIAPRVHNSGHYTMDAARTSQFEQHIRAITGLPLGETTMTSPAAVMINILGERDGQTKIEGLKDALAIPGISIHLYGKYPTKVDRKMGHINATGNTLEEARERAEKARKLLSI